MDNFDEMIEKAKEESKQDFLRFAKGIYGTDECVFDHIFEIPIIGRYDADELVTTSLSTKTEDELFEIINETINGEKLWTEEDIAKYVNFDENNYLNQSEKSEWFNIINCNAAIVYNDELLKKHINVDSSRLSKEKLYDKYKTIMKETFTHERVHVNNAYYNINLTKMTTEEIANEEALGNDVDEEILSYYGDSHFKGMREDSEELNGAENSRYDIENWEDYEDYWKDNNELMVESIARMMSNYEEGDTLDECLKKVIKGRNGKTIYPGLDDRFVLGTYVLFTDELTEWMMFGAYDFAKQNKLQKRIIDICGTDMPLNSSQLKEKFEEYIKTLEKISDEQKDMLEMLGFSIDRKIDKEDMKKVAMSEKALDALSGDLFSKKTIMQRFHKEENIKEQ